MYKVLIIDDEPWARKVVRKLGQWETLDLEIVGEAGDGIEGLEMIDHYKPHIVITDMRMPGIDGVALLKRIHDQMSDVMVIAMSGYNDFIYLKQAIQSSAIDYLLKPVNPDELNAALAKGIDQLNSKRKNQLSGLGTLHLFKEETSMKVYLEMRQRVHENLIGLNAAALQSSLTLLSSFLTEQVKQASLELVSKIGHDLIQMLQEYLAVDEYEGYERWKEGYELADTKLNDIRDMSSMLKLVSDIYVEAINQVIALKKDRKHVSTADIQDYMAHHFAESMSLESIAKHFFVSKEHLSRIYKAAYNRTINEQLIMLRMEKAKLLIHEQKLAIKDVAAIVGYQDLAYFYRVFKKYVGVAPGKYRACEDIKNVQ